MFCAQHISGVTCPLLLSSNKIFVFQRIHRKNAVPENDLYYVEWDATLTVLESTNVGLHVRNARFVCPY